MSETKIPCQPLDVDRQAVRCEKFAIRQGIREFRPEMLLSLINCAVFLNEANPFLVNPPVPP
ncbi:MAG: hypothetical protein V5B34_00355 [Accumulibacter sp.]|jgi:hypothetical protein|uniref:hypothetical protein n=1 Tax=Accumulibacter sp. TaxID=2053492 RepID=UPI002FC3908D